MSFSPSNYLRGLGWQGPGKGLTDAPHARSKPVIIAQKKTLSGVGKDRDQAFPWWEMVFATVASKGAEKTELHRTSTGIISNKPAPQPSAYASGDAPTLASTSALNLDAMGLAKLEAARRQLYSSFLRGKAIDPTVMPEGEEAVSKAKGNGKKRKVEEVEGEVVAEVEGEEKKKKLTKEEKRLKKEAKRLRRESKSATSSAYPSDTDSLSLLPTPTESPSLSPPPASAPSSKKLKKSKLATPSTALTPEEASAAEEEDSREAARRALKEERKLQKVVRKALKEKKSDHHQIPVKIRPSLDDDLLLGCSIKPSHQCSLRFRLEPAPSALGGRKAMGVDDTDSGGGGTKWTLTEAQDEHSHELDGISEQKRVGYAEKMEAALINLDEEGDFVEGLRTSGRKRTRVDSYQWKKLREKPYQKRRLNDDQEDKKPTGVKAQPPASGSGGGGPTLLHEDDHLEGPWTGNFQDRLRLLVITGYLPFPPPPSPSLLEFRLHACAAAIQRGFSLTFPTTTFPKPVTTMRCVYKLVSGQNCGALMKVEKALRSEVKSRFEKGHYAETATEFGKLESLFKFVPSDSLELPSTAFGSSNPPPSPSPSPCPAGPSSSSLAQPPPPGANPSPTARPPHAFLPHLTAFLHHLHPALATHAPHFLCLGINSVDGLQKLFWLSSGSLDRLLKEETRDGPELSMVMRRVFVTRLRQTRDEIMARD